MKFHIEKSVFEDAISTAIRAVASKSSISALEGLLLEAEDGTLTVTGYNMQTAIRTRREAQVEREGRAVVGAKLFAEIIRKMPEDMVTFDCENDFATNLSCGLTHYSVMALSADDYPALPDVGETTAFDVEEGTLRALIGGTTFAVSNNEARPVQTGALFDVENGKLSVVASDGFRLAIRSGEVETAERFEFVVPGAALNEVERMCGDGAARIAVGGRHVMFFVGSTELISRRLEGDFLDYRRVVPKDNPITIKADAKILMQCIERVSVVVSEKMKSPLRCVIGDGAITMSANTAIGKAKDRCAVAGDGGGMEIGFNARYLLEALKFAQEQNVSVSFKSTIAPAVIRPADGKDSFVYMVLPVRLKQN